MDRALDSVTLLAEVILTKKTVLMVSSFSGQVAIGSNRALSSVSRLENKVPEEDL